MKKSVLAITAALSLCAGAALAEKVHDWHQLDEVHKHLQEALHEMEGAQKANHYDMGGHAAKAEELMRQAEHELHDAVESVKAESAKKAK